MATNSNEQLIVTFEFISFNGTPFYQSVVLQGWEQVHSFIEQLSERGISRYTVEIAKDPLRCLRFVDMMQQE